MVAATFLGLLFVPLFFVLMKGGFRRKRAARGSAVIEGT
jgi:hypothetical protein